MPSRATFLEDHERRVLANLSIPRNVDDLSSELRADPYSDTPGEQLQDGDTFDIDKTLEELAGEGYARDLGEDNGDPAQIASRLADGEQGTLPIPDEKAKIYAARLEVPARSWRARGRLWMLTEDGLGALKAPVGPVRAPLGLAELQAAIDHEWSRSITDVAMSGSIHDQEGDVGMFKGGGVLIDPESRMPVRGDEGPSLGNALLPEEFAHWLERVLADNEQLRGQLRLPMSGGAGYSDATELLILDADTAKTASYAETSPTYLALSILAFTDADTGTTADDGSHIPTYTGYARKSAANTDFNAAASGTRTNLNALTFAACTGGTSNIVGLARTTAATLGRIIRFASVTSTTISVTQTPATVAAGALTDTLD